MLNSADSAGPSGDVVKRDPAGATRRPLVGSWSGQELGTPGGPSFLNEPLLQGGPGTPTPAGGGAPKPPPPAPPPAEAKGLGTVTGVFVPCVLSIIGVVLFLRLGW